MQSDTINVIYKKGGYKMNCTIEMVETYILRNGEKTIKVLTPPYDYVENRFRFGLAIARSNNLWGLIDEHGNEICEPIYTRIGTPNKWGYANVYDNSNLCGIYSFKDRKQIIKSRYKTIWHYQEEYKHFIVEATNGKMGVVRLDGVEIIIPRKYDCIMNKPDGTWGFEYGIAFVENTDDSMHPLRGCIDCEGNEIIELQTASPASKFWNDFYELRNKLSKRA